jgi:type IV pilus assembly protein PilA
MRKFRKQFRYGEKGFTLIELLIVIAVLGVLAAVVIPNVSRFTKSGQKAAAMQEMETLQTAVDAAMAEAGEVALSAAEVDYGPHADPAGTFEVESSGVFVGDFLRRAIDGEWTIGTDGQITAGHFKSGQDGWIYAAGSWTWGADPD